jgi:ABC-type multidrug transport system ATPase subunit
LEVRSVCHSFGKKAILSDIAFACTTGDITAIFGRNGSGKSTLFKILFGALKANSSVIYINGKECKSNTHLNRLIGLHHQEVFLPVGLKVRNIIPLFLQDGEIQNKIFYEPLIARIENKVVGSLSLGEQRYLQFLLMLNASHHFLLLDEPFTMVQPLYRDKIKEKILEYRHKKGFIISDHYYQDVVQIAEKLLVLTDGILQHIEHVSDLVQSGYLKGHQD